MTITSRQNPKIRHLRRLCSDSAYRRETGLFIADGEKCLQEAVSRGIELAEIVTLEELPEYSGYELTVVTAELLEYISPLKTARDVLFVGKIPAPLAQIAPATRYVILDGIQDSGNVGTIIRTGVAFGLNRFILTPGCADIFSPRTIRASMGTVFSAEYIYTDCAAIAAAKARGLRIAGTALYSEAKQPRDSELLRGGYSAAFGAEGRGLTVEMTELCDEFVKIPIYGAESLNVAVAAGIILYEMFSEKPGGK
ncbi:MAG: RNA methyltransferase [Oscillospiraceae bacterium]|jgi:TrmH family RNA methyltransferase|nr:RNA methyltransferase [Oscillospiraceae bacterium]